MSAEIKIVTHKGKRYYTRADDTPIINQGFNLALPFINGYAIVGVTDKKSGRLKYGILQLNGSYLLEPQFEFAEPCDHETEYMKGIARVLIGDIEYGFGLMKQVENKATLESVIQIINSEEQNNKQQQTTNNKPRTIMKQPNLSKSLICEMININKGKACAYALFKKYYEKCDFSLQETDTKVDPRKLGIWFEYLCTGTIPISGEIPQPQLLKSGTNKGELKAPYKIMEAHVENWKALSREYRFETMVINHYYHIDDIPEIGGASLRTDLLGKVLNKETGEMEVAHVDIKSSGKGENKWDADGWERSKLRTKSHIMIQPLHTKWLWWKMFGREIPFYFAWFDSSDENNFRFIRVEIPMNNIGDYPNLLMEFRGQLEYWEQEGFPPTKLPEICGECAIAASCPHCVKVPQVETVYFDITKSDFNK